MAYISPSPFTMQAALSATLVGFLSRGSFLTRVTAGVIPLMINSTSLLGATGDLFQEGIVKISSKEYAPFLLASTLFPVAAAIYTFAIYRCVLFFNLGPLSLLEAAFSGTLSLLIVLDSYHGSKTIPKIANLINLLLKRNNNHDNNSLHIYK